LPGGGSTLAANVNAFNPGASAEIRQQLEIRVAYLASRGESMSTDEKRAYVREKYSLLYAKIAASKRFAMRAPPRIAPTPKVAATANGGALDWITFQNLPMVVEEAEKTLDFDTLYDNDLDRRLENDGDGSVYRHEVKARAQGIYKGYLAEWGVAKTIHAKQRIDGRWTGIAAPPPPNKPGKMTNTYAFYHEAWSIVAKKVKYVCNGGKIGVWESWHEYALGAKRGRYKLKRAPRESAEYVAAMLGVFSLPYHVAAPIRGTRVNGAWVVEGGGTSKDEALTEEPLLSKLPLVGCTCDGAVCPHILDDQPLHKRIYGCIDADERLDPDLINRISPGSRMLVVRYRMRDRKYEPGTPGWNLQRSIDGTTVTTRSHPACDPYVAIGDTRAACPDAGATMWWRQRVSISHDYDMMRRLAKHGDIEVLWVEFLTEDGKSLRGDIDNTTRGGAGEDIVPPKTHTTMSVPSDGDCLMHSLGRLIDNPSAKDALWLRASLVATHKRLTGRMPDWAAPGVPAGSDAMRAANHRFNVDIRVYELRDDGDFSQWRADTGMGGKPIIELLYRKDGQHGHYQPLISKVLQIPDPEPEADLEVAFKEFCDPAFPLSNCGDADAAAERAADDKNSVPAKAVKPKRERPVKVAGAPPLVPTPPGNPAKNVIVDDTPDPLKADTKVSLACAIEMGTYIPRQRLLAHDHPSLNGMADKISVGHVDTMLAKMIGVTVLDARSARELTVSAHRACVGGALLTTFLDAERYVYQEATAARGEFSMVGGILDRARELAAPYGLTEVVGRCTGTLSTIGQTIAGASAPYVERACTKAIDFVDHVVKGKPCEEELPSPPSDAPLRARSESSQRCSTPAASQTRCSTPAPSLATASTRTAKSHGSRRGGGLWFHAAATHFRHHPPEGFNEFVEDGEADWAEPPVCGDDTLQDWMYNLWQWFVRVYVDKPLKVAVARLAVTFLLLYFTLFSAYWILVICICFLMPYIWATTTALYVACIVAAPFLGAWAVMRIARLCASSGKAQRFASKSQARLTQLALDTASANPCLPASSATERVKKARLASRLFGQMRMFADRVFATLTTRSGVDISPTLRPSRKTSKPRSRSSSASCARSQSTCPPTERRGSHSGHRTSKMASSAASCTSHSSLVEPRPTTNASASTSSPKSHASSNPMPISSHKPGWLSSIVRSKKPSLQSVVETACSVANPSQVYSALAAVGGMRYGCPSGPMPFRRSAGGTNATRRDGTAACDGSIA